MFMGKAAGRGFKSRRARFYLIPTIINRVKCVNLLFVCLENLQRSPTAEDMVQERTDEFDVRSAGVSSTAVTRLDEGLLEWADRVYLMTDQILEEVRSDFYYQFEEGDFVVLGVPDHYFRGERKFR